jgi:hypothetical protein
VLKNYDVSMTSTSANTTTNYIKSPAPFHFSFSMWWMRHVWHACVLIIAQYFFKYSIKT